MVSLSPPLSGGTYFIRLKIKGQCCYAVDFWYSLGLALNGLTANLLSSLLSQIWCPDQTTLFIKGSKHSSYIFLSSLFQFPDSLQNYFNKPVTLSTQNQRSHHPLNAKKKKKPVPQFSLCSQLQPPGSSIWHVVSSFRAVSLCD